MIKKIIARARLRKEPLIALLGLIIFLCGFISGVLFTKKETGIKKVLPAQHEIRLGGYAFINPLLECENAAELISDPEIPLFHSKITDLIEKKIGQYRLTHVSVYFRDLNNGPWFGIKEQELFAPASLLKVPTVIGLYKQAEQDTSLLNKKVIYKGNENFNDKETIKPTKELQPGHSYSLKELAYRALVYSDNNASRLVQESINKRALALVYRDLGVAAPYSFAPGDFLSVKSYASFFRILFNASYLNKESSGQILRIMSESEFRDGIVAGVPQNIPVAHKFGERVPGTDSGIKQLHDCGIIYYPDSPYLLCIMTRGSDFRTLDDIIRDISAIVYAEVDRHEQSHVTSNSGTPQDQNRK